MAVLSTYSNANPSLKGSNSAFPYAVFTSFSALNSTGKETDCETGYSYFGARYYDPTLLTSWTAIDPMSDKYPSLSPYNYCAWNPVKLVDPDGEDPIGAIIEGATAVVTSVAVQYFWNKLVDGESNEDAFHNIDWGSALVDGLTTMAASLIFSGVGTAKNLAKLKSSKYKKVLEFTSDVVENFTASVSSKLISGEYDSFSDINFEEEVAAAIASSVVNLKTKKGNEQERLKSSRDGYKKSMDKYQKSIDSNKSEAKIKHNKSRAEYDRGEYSKARHAVGCRSAASSAAGRVTENSVDKVKD